MTIRQPSPKSEADGPSDELRDRYEGESGRDRWRVEFSRDPPPVESTAPLVSVVVPTYERPTMLRRAVESVRRQTYGNVELVVVDDCSDPPVRSVVSDLPLGGLRVTLLRHEENYGANAARNTGIRAASGEFVAFLDDDDEWEPTKLAEQVAAFQAAGPEVGAVYTGERYVQRGSEMVARPTLDGDVTRAILVGESLAQFSALMVRASLVERAGLPDERFPSWQDREWYLRLSLHAEFRAIPEPLTIRHTEHGDRIFHDYEEKRDVSYPLFVEKHRGLAAEYGWVCERRFLASLSRTLGVAALNNGRYSEARSSLLHSLRLYPLSLDAAMHLAVASGGRVTHVIARAVARAWNRWQRPI